MNKTLAIVIVLSAFIVAGCDVGKLTQTNPLVGNWKASMLTLEEIATIEPDNTLVLNNPYDGMRIYSYEIIENGTKMRRTNLDTEKTYIVDFKVIGNYKAIKMGGILYSRID